jgi:hypothetical protein
MNLHQIVSANINAVNPFITGSILISDGYDIAANKKQVPKYAPAVEASMQVQPLTASEIQHLDALNIQGTRRAIYINGRLDGLVRPLSKGGDIISFASGVNAGEWLVCVVSEQWPDWCRVAVVLQNP